jgi:hypothetical protein
VGYHFINLKRKEKQVILVIHLILKQVLFILGVRQPAHDEDRNCYHSREGQHYSLFSDKTAICQGFGGKAL